MLTIFTIIFIACQQNSLQQFSLDMDKVISTFLPFKALSEGQELETLTVMNEVHKRNESCEGHVCVHPSVCISQSKKKPKHLYLI
jgi:hypothetical protein